MTGAFHHAQLFLWEWDLGFEMLCLRWPETKILPISPSKVAGMTGAHHQIQLLVEMEFHKILRWRPQTEILPILASQEAVTLQLRKRH
jgi:hypothetical protein